MSARSDPGGWLVPLVVAAGAAGLVAALGATLTELGPWYRSLAQPDWTPPDLVFPIAWTTIFALAALSATTAWRAMPTAVEREWLVALFAFNGFLNILWSLLFFRLQRPDWALVEVGLLWGSVAALMMFVGRRSRLAAWLLVPYLAWVSVAALLNWEVVRLNAPFG
ncbi:MAG: TspO/MBR family protein [Thermaurantiacus sp.]